jgi:octaprenyl-diphosphate synthase
MDMLSTIKKPIEQELLAFNEYFKSQFKSEVPLLNSALCYIGEATGKMMRPMLVMLVAKSVSDVNNKTYAAASAMEMLHTASLLHDDVIDESDKRRGRPSVNVKFNNNVAVLTGDFLFSQSLNNAAATEDCRVVSELAELGKSLSRGEILQIELQQNGLFSEENYLKVIAHKTASLFICSCVCAVYTAGGSEELAKRYAAFGENVGLCFQIKDDIFDYFSCDIGKPTGSDMREGKITLPALYVLRESTNPILLPIKDKLSKGELLDEKEIHSLISISVDEGGIDYAKSRIEHYKSLAIASIPSDVPACLRDALVAYLEYTISRKK